MADSFKTVGEYLVEKYPDSFAGMPASVLDRRLRERMGDETKRPELTKMLREKIPFYAGPGFEQDSAMLMDVMGRHEKRYRQSNPIADMKEVRRGKQADATYSVMERSEQADDVISHYNKTKGLPPPQMTKTQRTFADTATPSEVDRGDARVHRTFTNWEEAKKIADEKPGRKIMSNGVEVYIIDKEGNNVAQGADDFVSYSPMDVNFSGDNIVKRGLQAGLGALTGQGDPLQQTVANTIDTLSKGPDPTNKDKPQWREGFGYPELGEERGRMVGQMVDLSSTADPMLKAAGVAAKALVPFKGLGRDVAAGLAMMNPAADKEAIQKMVAESQVERDELSRQGDTLLEGMPDVSPQDKEEMSKDLGGAAGRSIGAGFQMFGRTGGAEAIKNVVGPLIGMGGDKLRDIGARRMADDGGAMLKIHDAPATLTVKDRAAKDALDAARQAKRSAGDIYSKQLADRIGDQSDPVWKAIQDAGADAEKLALVRQEFGDAKFMPAYSKLMQVRRWIEEQAAQAKSGGIKTSMTQAPEQQMSLRFPGAEPDAVQVPMRMKTEKSAVPTELQGQTWTGRGLSDIRPGETWEAARKRILDEEFTNNRLMSAREKDIATKGMDDLNALTATVKTGRSEFLNAGGAESEMIRSVQRSLSDGTIPSEGFSKWYSGKPWANAGGADPRELYSKVIDKDLQARLLEDNGGLGKALLIVGDDAAPFIANPSVNQRAVFLIPSTGSSELDKSLSWRVVDRNVGQAIHQMANPSAARASAIETAKFLDDILATSSWTESATRGNPGFAPFQRASEVARVAVDSPQAMSDGSRFEVARLFSGQGKVAGHDAAVLLEQIRREGSLNQGRSAELLRISSEEPAHLFGERLVKKQGGVADTAYKTIRGARDAAMFPGKLSELGTDEMVRRLFPGLPEGVSAEDAIRAWHSISLIKNGMKPVSAIAQTNRLLVNFADKNPAQIAARPLVPFVKWISASSNAVFDAALREPERFRHLYNAMRMAQKAEAEAHGGDPINAKLKENWQNFAGIPAMQMGDEFVTMQMPSPMVETGDIVEQVSNTLSGDKNSGSGLSASLNPRIGSAFRLATGEDFNGRPFGVANKDAMLNAKNHPAYPGGGLFGLAKMQTDDPANFRPELLLGPNPYASATLETAANIMPEAMPPYLQDLMRVGLGRTSPSRLDPESMPNYERRKGLSWGPGVRVRPFDPWMASTNRAMSKKDGLVQDPEAVNAAQISRAKAPDPNELLLRILMERGIGGR